MLRNVISCAYGQDINSVQPGGEKAVRRPQCGLLVLKGGLKQ